MADDDVTLNGNKRVVIGLGVGTILAMVTSICTFWFGFYPTIATQAYVKEQMSFYARNTIAQEADLRLKFLEAEMQGLRTELRGITLGLNSIQAKLDYISPIELRNGSNHKP